MAETTATGGRAGPAAMEQGKPEEIRISVAEPAETQRLAEDLAMIVAPGD